MTSHSDRTASPSARAFLLGCSVCAYASFPGQAQHREPCPTPSWCSSHGPRTRAEGRNPGQQDSNGLLRWICPLWLVRGFRTLITARLRNPWATPSHPLQEGRGKLTGPVTHGERKQADGRQEETDFHKRPCPAPPAAQSDTHS